MLLAMVPLFVLFEAGILLAAWLDRRPPGLAREEADDEAVRRADATPTTED